MSTEPVTFDVTELIDTLGSGLGALSASIQRMKSLGIPVKAIALAAHLWPDHLPEDLLFLGCRVVRLAEPSLVMWGVVT